MVKTTKKAALMAEEYILSNKYLAISFSSFGACVRKICYKKGNDTLKNIAFTLPRAELYPDNPLYAGATLAPSCGRIEKGLLSINQARYQLTKNEQGKHHLHGGRQNLSFAFWELTDQTKNTLTFLAHLSDRIDGYPGNRTFQVTYHLQDTCLQIRQQASSDMDTCINMSNHTYFNLNAFALSGLDQYLMIQADQVIYNNTEHIPQEARATADTEFDFRSYTHIGRRIEQYPESPQFQTARGLNHYFLLSKNGADSFACALLSADQKTSLRLTTDAPALVLYSGGFMDTSLHYERADGSLYPACPGCAIAIEPSYAPFQDTCPYAAKTFDRFIQWEFKE